MEHLSACAGALVHESKADQPTKPVLTLDHVQNVQELKRGRWGCGASSRWEMWHTLVGLYVL